MKTEIKTAEEIAQYVIDNRFSKSENDKVTDSELYHFLVDSIDQFKPKWISVEDETPIIRGNYLVTNGKTTMICGILNNRTFYGINGDTHWMPLPTPPEQ